MRVWCSGAVTAIRSVGAVLNGAIGWVDRFEWADGTGGAGPRSERVWRFGEVVRFLPGMWKKKERKK